MYFIIAQWRVALALLYSLSLPLSHIHSYIRDVRCIVRAESIEYTHTTHACRTNRAVCARLVFSSLHIFWLLLFIVCFAIGTSSTHRRTYNALFVRPMSTFLPVHLTLGFRFLVWKIMLSSASLSSHCCCTFAYICVCERMRRMC